MMPLGVWIVRDEFRRMQKPSLKFGSADRRDLSTKLALAIAVGASGSYFPFYLALLVISISIVSIMLHLGWRKSLNSALTKLLIGMAFLSPSVLASLGTGGTQASNLMSDRIAREFLIFGGELFRLLVPWTSLQPNSISSLLGRTNLE